MLTKRNRPDQSVFQKYPPLLPCLFQLFFFSVCNMTDKLVVHRFIQVHQACEQVDQDTWTLLTDKTNATLAISHLCEKLVHSNRLDYNTTLQNLLKLVFTSNDPTSSTVYIRTIAYLVLTFDKISRPIEFTLSKQSGKGIHLLSSSNKNLDCIPTCWMNWIVFL